MIHTLRSQKKKIKSISTAENKIESEILSQGKLPRKGELHMAPIKNGRHALDTISGGGVGEGGNL